jgi:Flp pilus assembly protein TadG
VDRPTRRPGHHERGAAAVELAILLPLLLLILFGIIDFGRMLNTQIKVTEAAREGARAVSVGASSAAVDSRIGAVMGGLDGVTVSSVECAGGGDATVTVSYAFDLITPVPGLAALFGGELDGSLTIQREGVMPCIA